MKATICLSLLLIGLQFHCFHFTRSQDVQECRTEGYAWHKIIPNNADFAFRLYKELSSKLDDKNILFSPTSLSTTLAMLSLGAKSETQNQIYKGLGFNLSEIEESVIHQGFCQLIHRLNLPRPGVLVKIGNVLFSEKSLEILPTFLEDIKNLYHAEHFFADFLNYTGAKQQISHHVNNKTYGKIVTTVKDVDEYTRMVLVNYVLFDGSWKEDFHPRLTTEGVFLAYGNTTVKLNMMHKRETYMYFRDEDLSCSVVEVPYSHDAVAWFILPDEGKLKDVESSLVKEDLGKWRTSLEMRDIILWIPRFSISVSHDVKELFQRLGIIDAFNDHADLSGISAKHKLRISQALHEAVLVIHEDRVLTVQAGHPGAQGYEMFPLPPPPPPPLSFSLPRPRPPLHIKFDRPFLMVIIDESTQTILLMGKIVNPTKE